MRYVIGIDPGANGGIAVLDEHGGVVEVLKMPETPQDILFFLDRYKTFVDDGYGAHSVCYMEQVGQGMPGQSSSATAKFARHCGHLEMALIALNIPTHTVTPQKWEKGFQLGKSKGLPKTVWKNKLKSKAQQLFPQLGKKITLATSDALLLAEYGRKAEGLGH